MEVSCILCTDNKNSISLNNAIPWHIGDEFKYFNKITTKCESPNPNTKNALVMGRHTFDSLQSDPMQGIILPNRYNYVLSSKKLDFENECLLQFDNIASITQDIFQKKSENKIEKIFIIGGKNLYDHFVNNNLVKYIYLSKINKDYNCDNFVDLDLKKYTLISEQTLSLYDKNKLDNANCINDSCDVTFLKYENKNYVDPKYWTYHNNMPYINFDEIQYLNMMKNIISNGHYRQTRNAKTFSVFGANMVFDLTDNKLPLLTTKQMFVRGIIEELLFFLRGETNSKNLENKNVNIWKPNTTREFLDYLNFKNYQEGDMGPMYGFQWRHFNAPYHNCNTDYTNQGIDQFKQVLHDLEKDKFSRRILMTTYNPCQARQGVLYPCHGLTVQFGIENDNLLCCHMYQRSQDTFLGSPFNIASYSILVHIICNILNTRTNGQNYLPGKLYISVGDVHLYEQHIEVAKQQINRTPYLFPKLNIKKQIKNIEELSCEDFEIIGYKSHPKLTAIMIA
jgi:dihydrofolate reductase/thymidylate synthase